MKKCFTLATAILLLLPLFMDSCTKTAMDNPVRGNTSGDISLKTKKLKKPGHKNACYIQMIKVNNNPAGSGNEVVFTYDEYGNPVSILFAHDGTGYPNQFFKYDAHHRLSGYIGIYSNGISFEFWHKYTYGPRNQIIADTAYIFGHTGPYPTDYLYKYLYTYEYDQKSRIISVTSQELYSVLSPPVPGKHVKTFSYDSNGNLVMDGVTYDDKINIHQTNPIWMFLDRDYSVNNHFTADTYNSTGLPDTIRLSPLYPYMSFLGVPLNNSDITYSCP